MTDMARLAENLLLDRTCDNCREHLLRSKSRQFCSLNRERPPEGTCECHVQMSNIDAAQALTRKVQGMRMKAGKDAARRKRLGIPS
jgi:hypothetical protein